MQWIRRLLAEWGAKPPGQLRRVILVVLEGLEPALVERYLEQGLLHNLALLSDIGMRAAWIDSRSLTIESLATRLAGPGMRTIAVASVRCPTPCDVDTLCAADRAQQERLVAALGRGRSGVVVTEFDLPAQLARLFGPSPDANERQVIRDVHARMDEIIGKAFSFVDDRTALVVGIRGAELADVSAAKAPGLLFASLPADDAAALRLNVLGTWAPQ